MSGQALRLDDRSFRLLIVGAGLSWSVAFVFIALFYQLELYGDGAMFSYAVAVRDVWAFHWHNISGRTSVFLLTLLPAEALVGITSNPWAGIIAYGLLFYISPLVGLAVTYAADRSPGRLIFVYACGSTALLCPLIFGFPTEMWLAHAIFWPALALSHYAKPTRAGALLVFTAWLLLAFTHEGALVLLLTIGAMLTPRGLWSATFVRAAIILMIIVILASVSKIALPPDDYYADAFLRAALHFFDLEILKVGVVQLLLAAVIAYGAILMLLSIWLPRGACICALGILIGLLCIYWLYFDHSVHASSRYYLRTALVVATPLLGALGAITTMTREGIAPNRLARLRHALNSPRGGTLCALASIFLVVTLIHAIETRKFVASWSDYRDAIAMLAMNSDSDPALGDPRFVSAERISPTLAPLSWFSTIPYLSIILSNFSPNRLVIDPAGNYFWLSCRTATRNKDAELVVPVQTRDLVRVYSCLHR
ncbi:hypothetical protein [Bradyrhizobium sp. AUGA SZCCT0283]|uniref:hypothetical protein n=1 Tax=Bradyrhizobium sp. AUGA SZCCT0283 TaxID=2807671 RepID=UPI001BA8B997|nr:hypothetical protein [Bradyrhizobium sp. AUGA SZCCT0283]MBR1278363.1 hypothetical protein [Bradyrhizobium sp. AUGA SZCCT0283]